MIDREQIRRELDEFAGPEFEGGGHYALSRLGLQLLAELEQAEAKLAKVPALVEALEEACDWLDNDLAHAPDTETSMADRELVSAWRGALAAWENE